ncbi:protein sneaky [Leguminivora glycinivorella]|uniref:protein sneaky n=1 Tax=Leguminivora glycinivorella TaxID=1035111 RepID=UPI0020102F19|nr:protein sneaky [Leguminivora glycinivorella]
MTFKGFVTKCSRACVAFFGGFMLGQLYYNFMLKDLMSYEMGRVVSIVLSVSIGLLNVAAIQIRCISLLTIPMYLGKDGRRVLKGLILTYVVAGPIMNMSLNAREVVRVFACSNELTHNLSGVRDALIARPLQQTVEGMEDEIREAAEIMNSFQEVTAPIESEIELADELPQSADLTRTADDLIQGIRSNHIEGKYQILLTDQPTEVYQKEYMKKTEYRCNNVLSAAVVRNDWQMFQTWQACSDELPWHVAAVFCAPLMTREARDVPGALGTGVCDSRMQISSGLGVGYAALKEAKAELMKGPDEIAITYQEPNEYDGYAGVQAAKETGDRVKQAFEEKFSVIQHALTVVNVCQAILFLRIAAAGQAYHDLFLTNIDFDNVYITDLFKKIERRRLMKNQYTLLPLKKMERSRYIDIYSLAYSTADRHRLLAQMLKVLLEVVTATTFVMLDRLFYEALDVVSQHARVESESGTRDLEIEVEGTGIVANTIRAMISHLRENHVQGSATNTCLPHPRIMPAIFYLRIYGGYVWVLLLLCINPYTSRLRRLICSYFYPRREKQRVLHLYNDILKKRVKLDATLRRKAVQSVRAHYLSGESILLRFPNILGWLRMLPAARMACLICGEIEPRNAKSGWKSCDMPKCPFLYCAECWLEVRGRCLACDPNLAELSDQDSLSDDELPVF